MTSWVRLWHDMPTDPKFRTIARASKQPLPVVVAIFTFMLTDASANETERGRTTASDEDIASAFDLEDADVASVRQAMQGRVLDGDILAGWEKRQPKKEDNSAERAKAWREKKQAANAAERQQTPPDAAERPDAEAETEKEPDTRKPPIAPKGARRAIFSIRLNRLFLAHPTTTRRKQSVHGGSFRRQISADSCQKPNLTAHGGRLNRPHVVAARQRLSPMRLRSISGSARALGARLRLRPSQASRLPISWS